MNDWFEMFHTFIWITFYLWYWWCVLFFFYFYRSVGFVCGLEVIPLYCSDLRCSGKVFANPIWCYVCYVMRLEMYVTATSPSIKRLSNDSSTPSFDFLCLFHSPFFLFLLYFFFIIIVIIILLSSFFSSASSASASTSSSSSSSLHPSFFDLLPSCLVLFLPSVLFIPSLSFSSFPFL